MAVSQGLGLTIGSKKNMVYEIPSEVQKIEALQQIEDVLVELQAEGAVVSTSGDGPKLYFDADRFHTLCNGKL